MATAPAQADPQAAADFRRRIREDPAWFFTEILGAGPYDKQVEFLEAVRDHEWTSVNGANGVGKDWLTGRLVLWWMMGWGPRAKVVIMAPTTRQVSEIVWRETRSAWQQSRVPLGGRMLPSASKWDVSADWFALGFATDKPWNITGFHSENLLVIASEAHNMGDEEFLAIKRLHPRRLVLSGNPISESGEFYESQHAKRGLYHALSISAYDTPNLKWAERQETEKAKRGDPPVPGLVTYSDVEQLRADFGEDNPYFITTVLGQFAAQPDGLISLAVLTRAKAHIDPLGEPLLAGIDVAGPGKDLTVLTIAEKYSGEIVHQKGYRQADARPAVFGDLRPYKDRLEMVNVDATGMGYTWPFDLQAQGFHARGVMFGAAPSTQGAKRFMLLKDEIYWALRVRCNDGNIHGLAEPAVAQLSAIKWRTNIHGKTEIDDGKKARAASGSQPATTAGKSPDWAESTALCFCDVSLGRYGGWQDFVAQELDALARGKAEPSPARDTPSSAGPVILVSFPCSRCGKGTSGEADTPRTDARLCDACYREAG